MILDDIGYRCGYADITGIPTVKMISYSEGIIRYRGMDMNSSAEILQRLRENIAKVIVGKRQTVDLLLVCLAAGGHVLLEDVPGTGKTVLARSLAASAGLNFSRIQFTPDLLPSDVTGLNYYDQSQSRFVFRPGPVFCGILLADEINRATPRTQSALLECMAERQVTVDGQTRALEDPFFVIATQNPVETLGTFPLPEAQLDRFLIQVSMGVMTEDEELDMIDRFIDAEPLLTLGACCTAEDLLAVRHDCRKIFVHPDLRRYITAIVRNTRTLSAVSSDMFPGRQTRMDEGVSPRGTLALVRASQGFALLSGRDFAAPEDVQAAAVPVLAHRCLSAGIASARAKEERILSVLTRTEVPTEDWKR